MTKRDEVILAVTCLEWDVLEAMLEQWILTSETTFAQRQSLIPIRDFIFARTTKGSLQPHSFVGVGAGELGMSICESCGEPERSLIHSVKFTRTKLSAAPHAPEG